MSAAREELREALCRYTTDTLTNINSVREFCVNVSTWTSRMKADLSSMENIKDKATAGKKKRELEKELAAVLKATLGGLEKLDCFLEAVEKLAVTSLYVFTEENRQVLYLPHGFKPEHVQDIIVAARLICPLLLEFKRDAATFFLPKLQNLEVLSYQLDKYIQTIQKICEKFHKSGVQNHFQNTNKKVVIDLGVDLSGNEIQRMLCHIKQLDEIRKNPNFRLVFLFNEESCSSFINEFSERKPRMLQFLQDLEESAVQLDKMNKGAKISSVAGSSVGVIGGVLSIVGLALIPVTAGVSLGLTMTGIGLGVTSGVNSVVTTATEMGVNRTEQKKVSDVFQSFMEDVQSLQDCLEWSEVDQTSESESDESDIDAGDNAGKFFKDGAKAGRRLPKMAADIPVVAQTAVKGAVALGRGARAGLIAVNALFIGMDVFFICKDGISLAKGSETEASQMIRARAALWSSEMDSWQKIHDSLCEGRQKSEKNEAMLETPFYPEGEKRRMRWVLRNNRWVRNTE